MYEKHIIEQHVSGKNKRATSLKSISSLNSSQDDANEDQEKQKSNTIDLTDNKDYVLTFYFKNKAKYNTCKSLQFFLVLQQKILAIVFLLIVL
jgi:hypothetical protein